MTDDLVAFLRARLDEDEQAARAAEADAWFPRWEYDDFVHHVRDFGNGNELAAVPAESVGTHIARHDPARVLAEVEAKRRIIDEHQDVNDGSCGTCVGAHWGYPTHGGSSPQRFPCRTLRLLALPYADHPEYREEWRP